MNQQQKNLPLPIRVLGFVQSNPESPAEREDFKLVPYQQLIAACLSNPCSAAENY